MLTLLTILVLVSPPVRTPPAARLARADTATYADRSTFELVARAMARHLQQDSTVHDYEATVRYRLSFGFGKRKWAETPPVAAEEQEGAVKWELPNNLRVDLNGRRTATNYQGINLSSSFSRPWFVPRTLGDSIRVFGSDDPTRAAPHPLGPGADRVYRYVAGDSLSVSSNGRKITMRSITVTPKGKGPAYVAGRIWVDVATGDVVRFTFRFVGTDLWASPDSATRGDSASARRENKIVSRILQLDCDLEFALFDNKHWMPFRQVLSGRITIPLGIDVVIPFEAATTFNDYVINAGTKVVFTAPFFARDSVGARGGNGRVAMGGGGRGARGGPPPRPAGAVVPSPLDSAARRRLDSLRLTRGRDRTGALAGGGRFQIHRAPLDSLRRYAGWGDTLHLNVSEADRKRTLEAMTDLAKLSERLDRAMTGRPGTGFGLERVSDYLRYNRVEGTTVSFGLRTPGPFAFTDVFGIARYGLADHRVLARVALVRDAPSGRFTLAASRDLQDTDPFAHGISLGNSVRAILTGHDDGAYVLATGGRLSYEASLGLGTELVLGARVEEHRSVASAARAGFPRVFGADGHFPASPLLREGLAAGGMAHLEHSGAHARIMLEGEAAIIAHEPAARIAAELRFPSLVRGWITARVKGGVATGTDSVPQFMLQAGGINTVRGYDFGTSVGNALWAAQLDISRPGRGGVRTIFFADAGQAGRLSALGEAPFLSSVGIGVSFLGGFVRADLSHPLTNADGHKLRFDLIFGSVR